MSDEGVLVEGRVVGRLLGNDEGDDVGRTVGTLNDTKLGLAVGKIGAPVGKFEDVTLGGDE